MTDFYKYTGCTLKQAFSRYIFNFYSYINDYVYGKTEEEV